MATPRQPERLVLQPFFLHAERALALLGPRAGDAIPEAARRAAAWQEEPEAARETVLAQHLSDSLPGFNVMELQRAVMNDSLAVGNLVGIQQAFYFRKSGKKDTEVQWIEFHTKLNTNKDFTVLGRLNAGRLVAASAWEWLSGHSKVYILGTVTEATDERIELLPIFVGIRALVEDDSDWLSSKRRRIYPSSVDQFSRVDFSKSPSARERRLPLRAPEADVKAYLAEILGEPFVPRDWGGETSDLYTSRLSVEGQSLATAFLLKGPAFDRPMTIAALGKKGDQIDRLFREPAELFVLQHCHHIRAEVVNMMEVYAWDARHPSYYMILDGFDTTRVLSAYGKLAD